MEQTQKKNKLFKIIISIIVGLNLVATCVLLGFKIGDSVSSNNNSDVTKYTLYIGTNDKDTYKAEIPLETCLEKVTEICVKYTDGCTIYKATGYWKDEKGNITTEDTIACILEDIKVETVYKICDEVILALNQNSILIETSNVYTEFYSTPSK